MLEGIDRVTKKDREAKIWPARIMAEHAPHEHYVLSFDAVPIMHFIISDHPLQAPSCGILLSHHGW